MAQKRKHQMTPEEYANICARVAYARDVLKTKIEKGEIDMKEVAQHRKDRKQNHVTEEKPQEKKPDYSAEDFKKLIEYAQYLQGQVEALNAKVANLEHKAIQYQAVISYLETTK